MLEAGDHRRSLLVDGQERTFLLHVPEYDPAERMPVLILLHGRGIDSDDMVRLTGMNDVSDREGFVAVYPDGQEDTGGGRVWPWTVGSDGEVRQPREVDFLSKLVDSLDSFVPVDADRISCCGFSNGAILSYVAARDLPGRFAAIAGVAGFVGMGRVPPMALSILHIHGTRDRFVPYSGGLSARKGSSYEFPALPDALAAWLEATGCLHLARTESLRDPFDPTLVVRTDLYGPGREGSEVEVVTVEGGGHTWPGREPLVTYMGKWTRAFSASDKIWSFCGQRRRSGYGDGNDAARELR